VTGLLLLLALQVPQLPDSTGWGVHVLAIARAPDSAIWVGTYGQGIFVLRPGVGRGAWEHIRSSRDTAARSISWDFVHAFAFGPRGQVWYGTVGNGWGLSTDGGKTWKNWEFRQLGPEWQYVTPDGIRTVGDTTYIATADGIKLTWDDGQTWRVITDSIGATTAKDSVWGRIENQYVQWIAVDSEPSLWVSYQLGVERSRDGGRHWAPQSYVPVVTVPVDSTGVLHVGRPHVTVPPRPRLRSASLPEAPRHTWFRRPIDETDQPHIDQTYRFGSTMGGTFQPHQGVEFNNGDGTPVHAIGDGVVVHAGPAEQGALTVAIKHDRRLSVTPGRRPGVSRADRVAADPGAMPRGDYYLFSVYYHNSKLLVHVGDRVKAGDVISLVGNTGRATNDHLHLEVHASPFDSTRLIVDPAVRYPPYNTNPELWIEPLPGTGIVAGQVWDSAGKPAHQARIYGLVKPEPRETPFSFVETYGPRNHADPIYQEHFAISDVPPGEYVLGVEIGGKRVYRRVKVEAGKLTWVEFRP
jgi:murein DD-endopeptidase MepM/ murein hydrolase activator NlpD